MKIILYKFIEQKYSWIRILKAFDYLSLSHNMEVLGSPITDSGNSLWRSEPARLTNHTNFVNSLIIRVNGGHERKRERAFSTGWNFQWLVSRALRQLPAANQGTARAVAPPHWPERCFWQRLIVPRHDVSPFGKYVSVVAGSEETIRSWE